MYIGVGQISSEYFSNISHLNCVEIFTYLHHPSLYHVKPKKHMQPKGPQHIRKPGFFLFLSYPLEIYRWLLPALEAVDSYHSPQSLAVFCVNDYIPLCEE